MKTRQRISNWYTTIIGMVFFGLAVWEAIDGIIDDEQTNWIGVSALALLGWVFLTARDTLLEGVFLNLFKVLKGSKDKPKDPPVPPPSMMGVILLLVIAACTPQQKLNRLLNKYPNLQETKTDTLIDTVKVTIPEVRIDTVVHRSDDVTAIDSLFSVYGDKIDSLTAHRLGESVKYYITNEYKCIEDTLQFRQDSVDVTLWQDNSGHLRLQIQRKPYIIERIVKQPCTTKTIKQVTETRIPSWIWVIIGVIAVLYVVTVTRLTSRS